MPVTIRVSVAVVYEVGKKKSGIAERWVKFGNWKKYYFVFSAFS